VDLSNKRVDGLESYTELNPNPKCKFLLSKKDALLKRKKNTDTKSLE
jgi:hypothetical protein